ncbi:hypothetical protein INR49_010717 [Caranx melampygus]|nr:hypothetical protein INR49_010717 [Caranx melampygus]
MGGSVGRSGDVMGVNKFGGCVLQVRSDGEARRPECSQAEDCLDGGPGATEDRLPLSVIQLHKGILGTDKKRKSQQEEEEENHWS